MKFKNSIKKYFVMAIAPSFLVVVWMVFWGGMDVVHADDLITCRYLSSRGQNILLELNVGSPAPSMIIFIQKVPAETDIIKSSPKFKKYDKTRGQAKWLLTGVKPGRIKMAMTLSKPIKSGQLSGEIRYKNPLTGKMVTMSVMP